MTAPFSRFLSRIIALLATASVLAWFATSEAVIVSQSGHTYVLDSSTWCITDSTDTVSVDTTRVSIRIVPDSLLTDSALVAHGFPDAAVVIDSLAENYYLISIPDTVDAFAYLDSLESWDWVEWARFDVPTTLYTLPSETYFGNQWGFADAWTRTAQAWDIQKGSSSVLIGIIDSGGPCSTHEDLGNFNGLSVSFVEGDANICEPTGGLSWGHGTCVAGIAGALTNNSKGVAGVAGLWGGSSASNLVMLKTALSMVHTAAAIRYAADNGIKVINISQGQTLPPGEFPDVEAQIEYATEQMNCTIVCAGGQPFGHEPKEWASLAYPASSDRTIAVGAEYRDGSRDGFFRGSGAPGADLDLMAPGVRGIATTDLPGYAGYTLTDYTDDSVQYGFGGTSAASPFVAGVAALMYAANPDLTWTAMRDILRASATKIDSLDGQYFDPQWGYGRVNVLAAVVGAAYGAQLIEGTIDTSVTLPDSRTPFADLYFGADFGVASGATVTIRPGATVYIAKGDYTKSGADTTKVEFLVDGTLIIGDPDSAAVVFSPLDSQSGENAWYGIKVDSGGVLQMSNAMISGATYGVRHEGTAPSFVEDCTFTNNSTRDLRIGAASDSCRMRVEGCTFTVGAGTGIELINNIDGVDIKGDSLYVDGSSTAGIQIGSGTGGKAPIIEDCSIAGDAQSKVASGILHANSSAVIRRNTIADCKYGIEVTSGSPSIGTADSTSDNHISGCSNGILSSGASATPVVRNNHITSNTYGVQAKSGSQPNLGTGSNAKGLNTMTGNTTYCIWNRNTGGNPQVPAQYNYFGSCDQGIPYCANGNVDVTGQLCTAPATAVHVRMGEIPASEAKALRITGVFPNPMVSAGDIQFTAVAGQAQVRARIFDVTGRLVRDLGAVTASEGANRLRWDGQDGRGSSVGTGLYFVRLSTERGLMSSARVFVVR